MPKPDPEYDEWLPADDLPWEFHGDLWEHQGNPLTVGELGRVLNRVDPTLPVWFWTYPSEGENPDWRGVEISYTGTGDRPDAIVITIGQIEAG